MPRKVIIGIAGLIIIFSAIFFLTRKSPEQVTADQHLGIAVKEGVYSADDIKEYPEVFNTKRAGKLTPGRFNWLIRHLDKSTAPPSSDRPVVVVDAEMELASADLTSEQLLVAQKTFLPLLTEDDHVAFESPNIIQEFTCLFYRDHPYRPATGKLLALVNSPHRWVRYAAKLALKNLGYHIIIPPRPTRAGDT